MNHPPLRPPSEASRQGAHKGHARSRQGVCKGHTRGTHGAGKGQDNGGGWSSLKNQSLSVWNLKTSNKGSDKLYSKAKALPKVLQVLRSHHIGDCVVWMCLIHTGFDYELDGMKGGMGFCVAFNGLGHIAKRQKPRTGKRFSSLHK